MTRVKQLNNLSEFNTAISRATGLVLVDFYTDWCKFCVIAAPKIDEFSIKYTKTDFYKVNCEKARDIAQAMQVTGFPTFVFFKGGKPVGKVSGADLQAIEEFIVKNGGAFEAFGGSGKSLGGGSMAGQAYVNPWADKGAAAKKAEQPAETKPAPAPAAAKSEDDLYDDVDEELLQKAIEMSKKQNVVQAAQKKLKEQKATESESAPPAEKPAESAPAPASTPAPSEGVNYEEAYAALKKSVSQADLEELIGMGFSELRALKALINSKGGVAEAASWIFDHQEDKDIDDPITFTAQKEETPEEKKKRLEESKALAKQLQAESRRKMEEAEKKAERERELKRIKGGEKRSEALEQFEILQKQREQEEKKIAARKAKEEKLRVKRMVEEDRLRRKLETARKQGDQETIAEIEKKLGLKTEGGAPAASASPAQQAPSASSSAPSSAPVASSPAGDECTLQIRMLDGSTQKGTFKPEDTMNKVKQWAQMLQPGSAFNLMTTFPRKIYSGAELNKTVKEAGLAPRGALVCTPGM